MLLRQEPIAAPATPRSATAGLYAAKPAFQRALAGVADALAARRVHPDHLTFAAVGCAGLGGLALLACTVDPRAALVVPPLVLGRLALNALDGMVAHRRGMARPWGKVLNETADRLSDVLLFAPLALLPGVSGLAVGAALVALLLASAVGVTAEAAGGARQYGGPMGKADRMLWLAAASAIVGATGRFEPFQALAVLVAAGAAVTAILRGRAAHAGLESAR